MSEATFRPLTGYSEFPLDEMRQRAADFHAHIKTRRTVRDFSDRPVPREVIEQCLLAAGTAPSGANQQPWRFVVVTDPEVKEEIWRKAEAEEEEFYRHRATKEWLDELAKLGTNAKKPFLKRAPYLIIIFAETYGLRDDGRKVKHYYVQESVGIATGLLIAAIHHAGLASLTHTPSPMGFLNEILDRPKNERPFLILVVGFPEEGAKVPVIYKKTLDEIATFI